MPKMTKPWDYLIVTAANDQQAKAYDFQIRQRQEAGEIPQVRNCLVISDTDSRRIGSGGSTLHCLWSVLQRERPGAGPGSFEEAEAILSDLRILIVHAGGDSRRLPAYSHCGKMFVPLPAKAQSSTATTLFDRLVPAFLTLPDAHPGQVVVASGDALLLFEASAAKFNRPGVTALGSFASANEAAHHGVFCSNQRGAVRRFLQKPSPHAQVAAGAVNDEGKALLDLGVMSCDAAAAVRLMRAFYDTGSGADGKPALSLRAQTRAAMFSHGIDLYREICCALGTDTTLGDYVDSVRRAGSTLDSQLLEEWFGALRQIPFTVDILPCCRFLHFGTTRQLVTSGLALLAEDSDGSVPASLILNSDIHSEVTGDHVWIEGCLVGDTLTLDGFNAVVGLDVVQPLRLHRGACLDLSAGVSRQGEKVWFLRYCDIDDTFKHSAEEGGTFCGLPFVKWLTAIGAVAADIWPPEVPPRSQTLWSARVFPALQEHQEFREWLWLLEIESATKEQKIRFLNADRYSSSEIALRVDQSEFRNRRSRISAAATRRGNLEPSQPQTYAVDH
jgi:fucokinase